MLLLLILLLSIHVLDNKDNFDKKNAPVKGVQAPKGEGGLGLWRFGLKHKFVVFKQWQVNYIGQNVICLSVCRFFFQNQNIQKIETF